MKSLKCAEIYTFTYVLNTEKKSLRNVSHVHTHSSVNRKLRFHEMSMFKTTSPTPEHKVDPESPSCQSPGWQFYNTASLTPAKMSEISTRTTANPVLFAILSCDL